MESETPEAPDVTETPKAAEAPETPAPFFAEDPVKLNIEFGEPRRQDRITVAFRALLTVPHLVVLFVLTVVAFPLSILGWFAALALGRLPRWIARYEMSVIAYSTRVSSYLYMLAGVFPSFSISASDAVYPIRVEIGASRVSRVKVFFRLVLAIPAAIAFNVVSSGLFLFSPIIWLVTLIRGRTPQALFKATASVIRYEARYYAYVSLVTDEYPKGLWGDVESMWAEEPVRLRLSRGAKWVMRIIVLLGIANVVAGFVLPYELRSKTDPVLLATENKLESASLNYISSVQDCLKTSKPLPCIESHDAAWGKAFNQFAAGLSRVKFSDSQAAQASALGRDAEKLGQALLDASKAKTADGHTTALGKVQALLPEFETAAEQLLGHSL